MYYGIRHPTLHVRLSVLLESLKEWARGVAAWRVAPARSAPANARIPHPLLYSTSFESFLKIRALRAILVKGACAIPL